MRTDSEEYLDDGLTDGEGSLHDGGHHPVLHQVHAADDARLDTPGSGELGDCEENQRGK